MLTWCLAARTQPEKRSHGPPLHTASASWLILFHLHGAITVFTAVIAKVGPDHLGLTAIVQIPNFKQTKRK